MRLWVGAEAGGVGEGFEPEKYWEAQGKSSEWMWAHAGEELREYVSAARPRATCPPRRARAPQSTPGRRGATIAAAAAQPAAG